MPIIIYDYVGIKVKIDKWIANIQSLVTEEISEVRLEDEWEMTTYIILENKYKSPFL